MIGTKIWKVPFWWLQINIYIGDLESTEELITTTKAYRDFVLALKLEKHGKWCKRKAFQFIQMEKRDPKIGLRKKFMAMVCTIKTRKISS